jgi:two-component system NtrC family sensor kinase
MNDVITPAHKGPEEPEEALCQSERRYRSLFENMFEGLAHCRMLFEEGEPRDFVYLEVNRAFEKLTGLNNVVGKRVTEVVPGIRESQPGLFQVYGRVALTGQPEKLEIYLDSLRAWFFVSVYSTEQECFTVVFENITERKQAAEARRESEQRYRLLFNSISDAAFVHEEYAREEGIPLSFIEVNDAACQRLGYTREEFLRMGPAQIDAPGTHHAVAKGLEKVSAGQPSVWEGLHVTKNGRKIPVEVSSRLLHLNGKATYFSTARDVTERKRAEETNAHLAAIIESTDDAILTKDLDGTITSWNMGAERMFGYRSDEVMGQSIRLLLPPDRQEEEASIMVRLKAGERVEHFETIRLAKDGRRLAVSVTISPLKDGWGRIIGASKIVRDITERKQAEAELVKMSRALEQSPVTIVITDLAGNIEYVNPAFTKLTGYTREEAIGNNPRILKSGKMAQEDYQCLWEALTTGREWRGELLNKAKDGRLFWESAVISPIVNKEGQTTHFLAVKEDITQRKHLEEQLREAQKMEVVGQLAGGVAHDFNNILAATLMHLGLLQETPELTREMKESLREVEKETVRAANLTRQLLLFSRKHVARIQSLDMNVMIHDLLKMLRRLLGENIEVSFQGPSDTIWVSADSGMMEQVVMNLCINARDAMPNGGGLRIATTMVETQTQAAKLNPEARPGSFVCLSVTDTGCGMDETVLKRIFEPFFTTKEVGKGTGLGLATVYGIVKQHEGWVEVESKVGQGSSFRVYLPAGATPLNEPPTPSGAEEKTGGSETILLVEDEAALRRLVAVRLRKLGYLILEAGNGLEALKVWEEHHQRIALLFTDTLLPGNLTGLDLAMRFRREKSSLKVISSSGYSADLTRSALVADQEITFLPKPYRVAALAKIVRRCLDKT